MRKLTINRTSWQEYRDVLAKLEDFDTYGNLRGRKATSEYPHAGRLPGGKCDSLYEADYVVYSYSTPIAWHSARYGWIMPRIRYSVTTTKAQGKIATALALLQTFPEETR